MSSTQSTRTQTLNLDKKYDLYLAVNSKSTDATSNPLNLFDDLNLEDRAWFKMAQVYLANKKEARALKNK